MQPLPHPEPPPLPTRRRPCPMCPQYSDSLRWTGIRLEPPQDMGINAFLEERSPDGRPWVVVDTYQCWWCGHDEIVERPSE
jgi:hypothetical protein